MVSHQPTTRRLLAGFLIGPLVPILLLCGSGVVDGSTHLVTALWIAFVALLFVAYPALLLLGAPIFLLLRNRVEPRLWILLIIGALVATVPWAVVVATASLPASGSLNGVPTVIDGSRTAYWWQKTGVLLAGMALLGAIGGASFWAVLRWPSRYLPFPKAKQPL